LGFCIVYRRRDDVYDIKVRRRLKGRAEGEC
jgi:hypothetical protein